MSIPSRALSRAVLVGVSGLALTIAAAAAAPAGAGAAAVYVADDLRGADTVAVAQQALSALQRSDRANYAVLRQRLAALVAPQAGLDPLGLDAVWSGADLRRMVALLSALTQVGVPYRRLGNLPGQGFDCSGLTSWAWSQSGVGLPHQSGRQIRGVRSISVAEVKPGDLLYFPGHVMMALGVGGAMVHAPNSGNVVEIKMLSERQHRSLRAGDPLT